MRIVIHNFGPIKEADIETKRYTVFIGQTSTGKCVDEHCEALGVVVEDGEALSTRSHDFMARSAMRRSSASTMVFCC